MRLPPRLLPGWARVSGVSGWEGVERAQVPWPACTLVPECGAEAGGSQVQTQLWELVRPCLKKIIFKKVELQM